MYNNPINRCLQSETISKYQLEIFQFLSILLILQISRNFRSLLFQIKYKETIFEKLECISRRIGHYDIIAYGIGTCVKIVPRRKEPIIQTKWTFKYLLSHITLPFIYKGQFKFLRKHFICPIKCISNMTHK